MACSLPTAATVSSRTTSPWRAISSDSSRGSWHTPGSCTRLARSIVTNRSSPWIVRSWSTYALSAPVLMWYAASAESDRILKM